MTDVLDEDAEANLTGQRLTDYYAYKAQLIADNVPADCIEIILRGFIWNELEEEANNDTTDE